MNNLNSTISIVKISIIIVTIWTIAMFTAAVWNSNVQKNITTKIVLNIAHSNFNKDLAYRKWGASHGGVYVIPNKKTPPNPYLSHINDRDLITTDGRKLTLMNPAYMLREMMDNYSELYGIKGRIVGIKFLNPNNKATLWEAQAIKDFKNGLKEKVEFTGKNDNEYFRLMKPMIMAQSCQKCHGHLGFKNGSVRGGVSISIPMKQHRANEKKALQLIKWTAIIIWFLGFISIVFMTKYILHNNSRREKELEDLLISHKILDEMHDIMFVTDTKGKILRINKAFQTVTGYTQNETIGNTPSILKSHHHDEKFYKKLWHNLYKHGEYSCEIFNRKKSGEIFVAIENITSVKNKNGEILYFICIMHDITIRKDKENKISYMAHYDALTNLANRTLFEIRFEHALDMAHRNSSRVVLAYLDIDGFKQVNDTLGHTIGDKVLQNIAKTLTKYTRKSDTVARLGGDEFCIIFENIKDINEIENVMTNILKNIQENNYVDNKSINISGSIGISLYPEDGVEISILIECADTAMYECKANGKNNFYFYNKAHSKG